MDTTMRETLINAAIAAYDLCGSMQQAIRETARDEYGLTAKQVCQFEGDLLIEANTRIQRSGPKW